MASLYDRYRGSIKTCKFQLGNSSGEDEFMDLAAFSAQQALEFLLKSIIEEVKGSYKKTHEIGVIYEEFKSCCNISFSRESELLGMSDTITKWESELRYGSGIISTVGLINRCLDITECLDKEWLTYRSSRDELESNKAPRSLFDTAVDKMSV